MRPIVTDITRSMVFVCLCICVFVGHTAEADSCGPKEPCIRQVRTNPFAAARG